MKILLRWASRKRMALLFLSLCFTLLLLLSACGGGDKPDAAKDSEVDDNNVLGIDEARIKKGVKPVADAEAAVIETDYGKIVIELYPNIAPQMVERFKQLAREGFYNGTTFHRINAGVGLIQGGDPLSKDDNPDNDGSGDSPYPNVPGEFSDLPYERGTVGAARKSETPAFEGHPALSKAQALDSANCQFYITLKRIPEYDKGYTVFGRVIEGIHNADIIAGAPVEDGTERPADKIVIKSVTLRPRASYGAGEGAQ
jgi:cyclophilin family peptidyl-prolyl cis-trans isomerase